MIKQKIYFACSIRGGRDSADTYEQIVILLNQKATILTEIFADQKLTESGMNKPSEDIWSIDTAWVKKSNALVAEVTQPSLGVGYEIALAESLGKPILCLYKKNSKKLSAMLEGCPNAKILSYDNLEQVTPDIYKFIDELGMNDHEDA